ncbi:NUDIX domain-containing protein [Paraburkholderia hospita]|uniref:NUDIX hydrolase n=1 Tax=Paraburkholderia hospita TaxID=169430 RepID=A0ABN0FC84_9BURK|nr:NUDIX domain-containing protein [Paraburkholderia hospita]EIM96203.1 NUDIX hydrolase [Paraburkholderia hospita]OUL87592.1 hypothetical protein CA602_13460 [Paraburkholderia hospita]
MTSSTSCAFAGWRLRLRRGILRYGLEVAVNDTRIRALPHGQQSPRQCAHRELEEETSLVAASSADLWQFVGFNRRHHVFIVEIADSADPQPRNEIRSCRWFVPTRHRNTICKCADEANSGTGVGAS